MIKIENNHYQVEIDPHGSQIIKMINKDYNFNYLWNGSEWPKHAPLLFPAIGRSNDDQYLLNGQIYTMPQHGFAADQEFTVVSHTDDRLVLELQSNSETKKLYPFDFKLQTIYQLLSSGLSIGFIVSNLSNDNMPFALGSHPAFNVPLAGQGSFDDYYVEFVGNQEPLKICEIIKKPYPYRTGNLETIATKNNHQLKLNHDIFAPGLRIINNQDISEVILHSPKSKHSISLMISDFKNVCLWTKEDQDLPFLCIEPFNGLPDIYGKPADWYKKEGNLILKPQQEKRIQYEMKLL
ncbi:aldose 1-epimerase family protein [Bombilactobacillus bombi]|uniref:aldose 1-epimerase family protein n=1 Tax=Bombilactobacillus bombi TaxID=1303590 RepID=UPI0015E5DE7E|nr:aldose 1-epimerase family protein [Bombilactobacillus bombi]MBA1434098.1 aldose 1-epimerase family protein [Bombilactobacillus bombi]